MPTHAIIIPHYNDLMRLRRCLERLAADDRGEAEVVVVDNDSPVPVAELLAQFPFARLVTEPQKGAAHARNRGVAETTAPVLCFLDSDCLPAPGWAQAALRAAGKGDIVGGAIEVFDETPPPRSGAEAFETVFAFDYRSYILRKGFSVTANLVTRRTVFEAVGPFINGLSEDAEWCFRARSKGFGLALDEDLRVMHPTRSDWAALRKKWQRISREMFELHMSTGPSAAQRLKWAVRALAMFASAGAHLPKVLFSPKLSSAGERLAGALTLIRLRFLRGVWMMRQVLALPI